MTPYENCYVLIDYDSVANDVFRCDLPPLRGLADWLQREILPGFTGVENLRIKVRLYGGWYDDYGRETSKANALRQQLSRSQLVISGNRTFDFSLISHVACRDGRKTLHGTFRPKSNPPPYNEQKMVDSMLIVDLLQISSLNSKNLVFLCSTDRDFVPGILYATKCGKPDLVWVKRKTKFPGLGLKTIFDTVGVKIYELESKLGG